MLNFRAIILISLDFLNFFSLPCLLFEPKLRVGIPRMCVEKQINEARKSRDENFHQFLVKRGEILMIV